MCDGRGSEYFPRPFKEPGRLPGQDGPSLASLCCFVFPSCAPCPAPGAGSPDPAQLEVKRTDAQTHRFFERGRGRVVAFPAFLPVWIDARLDSRTKPRALGPGPRSNASAAAPPAAPGPQHVAAAASRGVAQEPETRRRGAIPGKAALGPRQRTAGHGVGGSPPCFLRPPERRGSFYPVCTRGSGRPERCERIAGGPEPGRLRLTGEC